jgi:tRNA(fMet)-specific endonuclease VapC
MTPRHLLDTDIIIHIRRSRPPSVLARFQALPPGSVAMSVITHGELQFGAAKSQTPEAARQTLDELAMIIPVLPLPESVGPVYGQLRADLQRRGEMIGNNDLWIAAHACAAGLVLVTNNAREFSRVKDLKLENWL